MITKKVQYSLEKIKLNTELLRKRKIRQLQRSITQLKMNPAELKQLHESIAV
jgi:hypothetical protein